MTDIIRIDNQLAPQAPGRNVEAILEQFLVEAQVAENSRDRYKRSLNSYFKWLQESGIPIVSVTLTELLKYKEFLEARRTEDGNPLSAMTISSYLNAIKSFYNWAEGKNYIERNPSRSLKSPKLESKFRREPIPATQCLLLIEYLKANNLRDFAIVNLIILTGLRTVEIVRCNCADIQMKDGERLLFVQGKGRKSKDKWVKLLKEAFDPIVEYLAKRQDVKPDSPLFASASKNNMGGRMIPGTISEMVKAALRAIGIDEARYTAHSLRHSAGSWALAAGASLDQVQDLLRHASSTTTQLYVKLARESKRLHEKSAEDFLVEFYKKLKDGAGAQPPQTNATNTNDSANGGQKTNE